MSGLDGATVGLQWATGGLAFLWVTGRRREVGLGYGWLLRGIYALMAAGAAGVGLLVIEPLPVRDVAALGVALATVMAGGVSVARRRAGVAGLRSQGAQRRARVAAMTGIDRREPVPEASAAEFPPVLDVVAPVIGGVGLVLVGMQGAEPVWLAVARLVSGAALMGAVSDAMLLGHWYLVQPGLPRAPLLELVRWVQWITPVHIGLLLVPTGMLSVLDGTIDDGYKGLLGWFWVACALTTVALGAVTRAALRERQYAAVMAATGLLYLAILTAFGTDLVARALLVGA